MLAPREPAESGASQPDTAKPGVVLIEGIAERVGPIGMIRRPVDIDPQLQRSRRGRNKDKREDQTENCNEWFHRCYPESGKVTALLIYINVRRAASG